MREWNLKPNDPLCLTLASDVRLGSTDYYNDQIWELTLGGGDPPALSLQTTYGLRARALRIFPRFKEKDEACTDPSEFKRPPLIQQVFPNFISLLFSPIPDIEVAAEYWAPESYAVAGRLKVTNSGNINRQIQMEWIGQLTPNEGQRMAVQEIEGTNILCGSSDGLAPVILITGGPRPGAGSYPSLLLPMNLEPGSSRQFTWAHAALAECEASFALAREISLRNWDAERSRLEMLNAGHVDVYTGDKDWDAAFMLAQKQAISLFIGPTEHLPHPSFVLTRQPDQGCSLCGDGSDYNHFWNGQPPLEAYYLASLVLDIAPNLAKGLLQNYLAVQTEDGFIDWKPGLAGQRSRLMAPPLLASLAWRIFEHTEDTAFLEQSFAGLLKFLQAWFTPRHDRDGDGIPEWDHPMQSGTEDHPTYSDWHAWALGVDISTAESPSLCAFLYRECRVLIDIANMLAENMAIPALQALADNLKNAIEAAWDEETACYYDWDRDTHYSTQGEWIGDRKGPGQITIQRKFDHPIRLLARLQVGDVARRRPLLFVHGASASGNPRVERITEDQFKWIPGWGRMTGKFVYSTIERVEVQGIQDNEHITLYSVGYDSQDHSLLAPLWAGIPDQDRARKMVEGAITHPQHFWRPFGLPACTQPPEVPEALVCSSVNLAWNALIAEGLAAYGYRREAAEMIQRVMAAVIKNLKSEAAFRRYYHADTGQGVGERNALSGLAPLGMFLDTLGVRLISPNRVALSGINPFPWPVTVKYRGMTILRQKDKTIVIFPDGQTVNISMSEDDLTPRIVALEVAPK
ncbi:MAG: hypothetical protein JXA78_19280 [Anaerolineales bacterium]|nr:hypothetical protein [Anaerolineales bacterium]